MGISEVPLAETVIQLLDRMESAPPTHLVSPAIMLAWRTVAGTYLAEHSYPSSFQDGVLEVSVDSPMLRRELVRLRPQLQARLASLTQRPIKTLRYVVQEEHTAQPPLPSPVNPHDEPAPDDTSAAEADMRAILAATEPIPDGLRPTIVRLLKKHAARKHTGHHDGSKH